MSMNSFLVILDRVQDRRTGHLLLYFTIIIIRVIFTILKCIFMLDNNLCSLPLNKIMDFNHIYSNIGNY